MEEYLHSSFRFARGKQNHTDTKAQTREGSFLCACVPLWCLGGFMATMKVAEKVAAKVEARHRGLGLSDAQALEMYWYILLSRRLDERM